MANQVLPSAKDLSVASSNKRVKWTAGPAFGMGVMAWLIPQVILGIFIAIIAIARDIEPEEIISSDDFLLNMFFGLFISVFTVWIIWWYTKSKGGIKALGFTQFKWSYLKHVLLAYGAYFVSFIIAVVLISNFVPSVDLDQEQELVFENPVGPEFIYAFIALVVLPPLYEEILFRGFVFQGIARSYGFIPAAIVVNGLFGLAHGQINVAIDTFILGVIASWLIWKTKSLWPAILLHAVKNLVAYVVRFVVGV